VREAGYEPGAVLPSTLAAVASVTTGEAALVVNAGQASVTTAITRAGELLLHRSVDLQPQPAGVDVVTAAVLSNDTRSEPAPVSQSPYLDPTLPANLNAELHNAVLVAPTSLGTWTDPREAERAPDVVRAALHIDTIDQAPADVADEIAQAVTAAVAYFEDTLSMAPSTILSAGALGADGLRYLLHSNGYTEADALRVGELLDSSAFAAGAVIGKTPRGALAGVRGALRG
jgi:type IV pilus assembly protein PilM